MSSLGAKVKDILHGGDSQDTKREESDRRIPGSFPAEDMQPGGQERNTTLGREREHEHNKLHKPNDPRGWAEEDQASRGPGYKDSGAGFEEARGQSAFNDSHRSNLEQPRDTTTEPYERTTGRTEPYERTSERTESYERSQRTEPYERTSERTEPYGITSERTPADRVDQPTTSNLPENKTNLSSQKEVLGSTVPTTQEHPYWGDLRPSGIPGSNDSQGSAVDKAKQYVQPSKTSPLVSGTFMKRREPTETTDSSNTQQTTQHVPDESKHDSHRKEALGGAAVAGAGAYELNKKHRDDERLGQTDPAATSSSQPEEHKGRSFPLLGRGHKDKDVDHPKETKEDKHAHHPKEVKEDKHAKEPKQEHESKLGALFRRGSKDEGNAKPIKEDKHAHQPKELKEDKYAREPKPEHDNKTAILAGRSHKDEAAPHTKDVKEEKHAKEPKPEHESKLGALFHRNKEPKEEKHAKEPKPEHEKKSGGLFHRRGSKDQAVPDTQDNLVEDKHHGSKAAPALAAAGAGGAATYLATRDRHDEHQPRDTTTTGRYQDSTAPRGTDQYNTLSQPSESKPYTGTTQHPAGGQHDFADTTQHSGSHHVPAGAAVAGGAATYLGTKDRHNDRQPRDISSTGGQYNPADTTQHSGSQHAPTTGSHLPIASQFSSTDRTHQPTGTQQTPAFTSQSSEPRQYTDTQHSTEHRHIPSGAVGAAGLAGAAGAGTYLATRDRDDDRQPRDTTTTGNQYNPADTTQYSTSSQHTPAVASQSSEPTRYTDTHQPRDTHHIPASAAGAAGLAGAGTYLATRDPYGDSHSREATTTGSQYNPADTTQYSTGSQHVPTTGTQHSGSGQYNHVSQDFASQHSGTGHHSNLGQTGNFSSQSTQPTDRSFHDSSARSYEPEASHSHRDAKLATGAAAGLGAGTLASHEHEQQGRNNEYTNEGTSRQPQASQYESGQPRTAGATDFSDNTTAPAHGIAKNEPLSGSDNHSDLPVFTQNANKGKYNTLSSGTPSGVRHE